ncbi:sel1 repeat family protein [Pseudoduganella sp. UC29_106]|uniref:sel1 repeat family protein n=1 Tax=Pseudoduganella sp. UC29_106 TaxID=3374553 RepID=UPI0037564DE0
MKKTGLLACLGLMLGTACADELGDAQMLWEKKNFAAAFQAFNRLAQAGNSAAQQQLGEMYGFGEGTNEDLGLATQWLERAVRGGSKEAPASLELVRRRAAHKADIQWYTDKFDGGDARYEKFACLAPSVPALSKTVPEIKAVDAAVGAWRECYGRFAANLNAKAAPTNTIPANVLELMNQEEFERASTHIGRVYTGIAKQAQASADEITKKMASWRKATEDYVTTYDKQNKAEMTRLQLQNDIDAKAFQNMQQTSVLPKK